MSNKDSLLNDPRVVPVLISILVKRLGGVVKIEQADLDNIAYSRLIEEGYNDGSVEYHLIERKCNG